MTGGFDAEDVWESSRYAGPERRKSDRRGVPDLARPTSREELLKLARRALDEERNRTRPL
jgi:hypothetical protein